jgi:hypothetical protein
MVAMALSLRSSLMRLVQQSAMASADMTDSELPDRLSLTSYTNTSTLASQTNNLFQYLQYFWCVTTSSADNSGGQFYNEFRNNHACNQFRSNASISRRNVKEINYQIFQASAL